MTLQSAATGELREIVITSITCALALLAQRNGISLIPGLQIAFPDHFPTSAWVVESNTVAHSRALPGTSIAVEC